MATIDVNFPYCVETKVIKKVAKDETKLKDILAKMIIILEQYLYLIS